MTKATFQVNKEEDGTHLIICEGIGYVNPNIENNEG